MQWIYLGFHVHQVSWCLETRAHILLLIPFLQLRKALTREKKDVKKKRCKKLTKERKSWSVEGLERHRNQLFACFSMVDQHLVVVLPPSITLQKKKRELPISLISLELAVPTVLLRSIIYNRVFKMYPSALCLFTC